MDRRIVVVLLMSVLWGVLAAGGTVFAALVAAWALAVLVSRHSWTARWRGHTVLIQNFASSEVLSIDGSEVVRTTGSVFRTLPVLTTVLDGELVEVRFTRKGPISAHLTIGGEVVDLSYGRTVEVRSNAPASVVADPRQGALHELVEQISGADPSQRELAVALQGDALGQLNRIEDLEASREAHRRLGGADESDMVEAIGDAENRLQELLQALRELHLAGLEDTRPAESDVLARLEVELVHRRAARDRTRV